jgi:VanZ family protein
MGLNQRVGVVGRVTGFAIGFLLTALAALGVCTLYRGAWMPMALVGLAVFAFSIHARLSKAPGSAWLVTTFALGAMAAYTASVGASPVRAFSRFTNKIPYALLFASLIAWFFFCRSNSKAQPKEYLYLPSAIALLGLGWVIVFFSGGGGGADPMVRFAMEHFGMTSGQAEAWVVAFRKMIHFTWYGLLALSAYRLANPKFDLRPAVVFGLQIALSFAIYDEFRQSTATNRTGTLWDVGLDMLGAITFIGISVLRYRHTVQPPAIAERSS